jgi:hypothetical protein
MWYQAKKARKLRFEELVGEKMVDVCGKALPLILEVRKRNADISPWRYGKSRTHSFIALCHYNYS